MKKNLFMIVFLSLSPISGAYASTEQFVMHLGEEKLSETSSGSYKCEFGRGNIEKGAKDFGIAINSAPGRSGVSKAGSAK